MRAGFKTFKYGASIALAALAALTMPASADDPAYPAGTIFTNSEDAYFAKDEGRAQPAAIALRFDGSAMQAVDAFGEAAPMPGSFTILQHSEGEITASVDGITTQLRRARGVSCWGAVKRAGDVAQGEDGWVFYRDLTLHDQGGRVAMGGNSDTPLAVLRIRRVSWAKGSNNRPSLVIYVHDSRDGASAISYSWADGGASRVGINLRWMQASCTVDGAESAP